MRGWTFEKQTALALELGHPALLKQRCDSCNTRAPTDRTDVHQCDRHKYPSRLRSQFACGEGCRAAILHGLWKTTTFLGAPRLAGLTAPIMRDGAMIATAFCAWVRQILVPPLTSGDSVETDKLSSHKTQRVPEATEPAACQRIVYPSGNTFAKRQALLRPKAKRITDVLWGTRAELVD